MSKSNAEHLEVLKLARDEMKKDGFTIKNITDPDGRSTTFRDLKELEEQIRYYESKVAAENNGGQPYVRVYTYV